MITKFEDYILEDRHFVDKKYYDLEEEFEPTEPTLQKIYYNEIENLYQNQVEKYHLILDILNTNNKVNKEIGKQKPTYSYFKKLLKMTIEDLKELLNKWKGMEDEEWHLPQVKATTKIK